MPVSRSDLKIKPKVSQEFEPGSIFYYTGSAKQLKGFLLVHRVNPKLENVSKAKGQDVFATDHVVAEVLKPELNYADNCLFWVEKRYLRIPSLEEFATIYSHLKAQG